MRTFTVYFLTSRRHGALYIGVTSDLARRVWEHREGLVPGFTKKHGIHGLVYFETFETARPALQRERNLKHWSRDWKIALIERRNPDWRDLYPTLGP